MMLKDMMLNNDTQQTIQRNLLYNIIIIDVLRECREISSPPETRLVFPTSGDEQFFAAKPPFSTVLSVTSIQPQSNCSTNNLNPHSR